MKRYRIAVAAAALLGALLAPTTALAGATKVDVCHIEGNGSFHLINVAEPAYPTHVGHGDRMPGDAVPGMDGYVFDGSCTPVAFILARAWSVDAAGGERPIAILEDTDGSTDVSVGDTVRLFEYPLDFDPAAFGTYAATEHVVDAVNPSDSTVVSVTSGGDFFVWVTPGTANEESFAAQASVGGADFFLDVLGDSGAAVEYVQAMANSPGNPSQAVLVIRDTNRNVDDPHVNVEING